MGNVPVNLAIVAGTGQRTGGPGYGSYTKGFTNPFGTVWFNDLAGAMSIYATGTSSATPTTTPTPVPTSTPTPTQVPAPTSTPTPTQYQHQHQPQHRLLSGIQQLALTETKTMLMPNPSHTSKPQPPDQ